VLDSSGGPVHRVGHELADWPAAHHTELAELRRRGLLASSSIVDGDGSVSLHPLGARGRVRGFLAVGTAGPLDRSAQSVVAVAVSLLSIAAEQDERGALGGHDVRAATLRLLFAGASPAELPLELLGWGWLADGQLRVLLAGGTPAQRAEAVRLLDADDAGQPRLVVDTGAELVTVVPDSASDDWPEFAGLPVGGSSPADVVDLGRLRTEALQALSAAPGPGVRWYGQLAAGGMLGALDPDAARGVSDALLAPLDGRRGDLASSLAAWLARHGQWDTAAADLGVHRHTLRYRMRRVEELLGRSLDDPDLRAELWLALRVRGVAVSHKAPKQEDLAD